MKQQQLKLLPRDRIKDPEQALRSDLTPESLEELAASIKTVGIIEPLIVKQSGDDWEIIAGHRRFLAAGLAGLEMLPCVIVEADDLKAEVLKLHENMARAEISAVDWAKYLTRLKQQYQLSNAKLAGWLGMSEPWVEQHLAILKYPDYLQNALSAGKMPFTAARELAAIKDETKRRTYTEYAVKGGVTPTLAANWRRTANLDSLPQEKNYGRNFEDSSPELPEQPLPICPVCQQPVPLEEATTITVHTHCQPEH